MWIPAAISAGASVYNMINGAKQAKERDKQIKSMQAKNTDLANIYKAEADRDYLSTQSAKSALGLLKKAMRKNIAATNNKIAANGGTNEAKVAAKAAAANRFDTFVKNLARRGEEYKQRNRNGYVNILNRNDQIALGEADRKAASNANASNNILNALSASLTLLEPKS